MTCPRWLKAAAAAIAALASALAGVLIYKTLRAELGAVAEGSGDVFAVVAGAPGLLDVLHDGQPIRVKLPEGITASRVKAVAVVPSGAATVEVLP